MIDEGRNGSERVAIAERLELELLGLHTIDDTEREIDAALTRLDRAIAYARQTRAELALRRPRPR